LTVQETDTAEKLAIEAAQKDPARFAELYENNFDRVYAYIARRSVLSLLTMKLQNHSNSG